MKQVNPDCIQQFIDRLTEVVVKYSIKSDMILNKNEMGYMFGYGAKLNVVVL